MSCVQFESPEVFSRASQQVFRFNRQLGEIVIAPQYVLQQCREDKKDYEVSQSVSVGDSAILLYDVIKKTHRLLGCCLYNPHIGTMFFMIQ